MALWVQNPEYNPAEVRTPAPPPAKILLIMIIMKIKNTKKIMFFTIRP